MITSTHYRFHQYDDLQTPIRLHETTVLGRVAKGASTALSITLLLMAPPAIVYVAFLMGEADFTALRGSSPGPLLAVVAGLMAVWTIWRLVASRFTGHLSRNRIVTINADQVTVRERAWFRWREWREPLAHYCGLESKDLKTPAGRRQKLILKHPQPGREIALWVGDQVPVALVKGYNRILRQAAGRPSRGRQIQGRGKHRRTVE